ncbi:RHS repeat-associated core domain-containing protein [Flavobacterium johnsoniae]|jgi:RHS repeat-associated protein|uniref:Uncharacterized protein n=3 Tax=Flavobacterium johnsoniae TaxID=986 RepID=A5FMC3_FLAJ1|nr:hypothetical protein Fjoh_0609 [Flavobacterium johnsoniae UW101]SHJ98631.1 RHS repeat-associated core domain-containing protein [Flavobacterium johnsoniae]
MLVPNRHESSKDYRYGFQGQEKDDEIRGGEGNSINYTFRMHDPRIGRFFAVDPLFREYAYNSPYSFSENRVMDGVEREGLEVENINAYLKAKKYGVDALEIKKMDDGMGNVSSQLYSLRTLGITPSEFANLRDTFLNAPQTFTNNFMATYKPVQKANSNILSPGDEIGINLQPATPFPIFVRVMNVVKKDNSFEMTFATLEGHTDAGYITFSGVFNKRTGQMDINIFNETRENLAMAYPLDLGRGAQILQWKIVMKNIAKAIQQDPKNNNTVIEITKHIEEYEYDESGTGGKGKLVESITEQIDIPKKPSIPAKTTKIKNTKSDYDIQDGDGF